MKVGNKTFHLWVVATEAEREHGLMDRPSLPADGGMVFVFRDERPLEFWMKNTLIPLDLIYVDAGGRVVSVKQGKPLDETNIPSDGPARFTIELNVGAAAAAGVKAGDQITLPAEVIAPRNLE